MKQLINKDIVVSIVLVVTLFVGAEIIATRYSGIIALSIGNHEVLGKIIFTLIACLAIVVPVISNMFLIPFGVVAWGPFLTAILCILGWWMGSVIAFYIARTYKEYLWRRYPSLQKYTHIDSYIHKRHETISLIVLRITLPVDVLSYALGLFSSRISWKKNAVTTLIGITPFAFVFAYAGKLPLQFQILLVVLLICFVGIYTIKKPKDSSVSV